MVSKEHGKLCIGIFYEKYCVSHILCKMSLTIFYTFFVWSWRGGGMSTVQTHTHTPGRAGGMSTVQTHTHTPGRAGGMEARLNTKPTPSLSIPHPAAPTQLAHPPSLPHSTPIHPPTTPCPPLPLLPTHGQRWRAR